MEKIIKVGTMPGKIQEAGVTTGMTISDVLDVAELNSDGYQVKVNGEASSLDAEVTEATNTIILSKMLKGNQ